MLRRALFALAGVAVAALLAADRSPRAVAADKDISGNWQLSVSSNVNETAICILKIETKEGKPTATVVFAPEKTEIKVTEVRTTESRVLVTLKQTRTIGKQTVSQDIAFVGVRGADEKTVFGSTGTATSQARAKLTRTDKEALEKNELTTPITQPAPMAKVAEIESRAMAAMRKAFFEKDAEKKKGLQKEVEAARQEAEEKITGLYREAAEMHPDSPATFGAVLGLLRMAPRVKLTSDEAAKLVQIAQKQAAPYGPLFGGVSLAPAAEALAKMPGFEAVALSAIEPAAKALTKDDPDAARVTVLSAYQTALSAYQAALEKTGKAVAGDLAKLDAVLDTEYLATVPPFKPGAFAGRKDKSANQVVVMELFTGAQCPPCVAADVAFDALQRAYKPTDLVLIQYHLHIPGPDPLTNADTDARASYYDTNSTPTTLFNGKKATGGGGFMSDAEGKYKEYAGIINPLLEKSTDVKVAGSVTRKGEKLDIAVEVAGAEGDDVKLRLLVVEETVKYVGGNQLRFHHQVVRAMPGGAEGVAIKDKAFKHTAAVDFNDVRKGLTKYLDEYAANTRPFPKPDRPMDLKAVRVIALVQNDKTKEILQAAQFDVDVKVAGGH